MSNLHPVGIFRDKIPKKLRCKRCNLQDDNFIITESDGVKTVTHRCPACYYCNNRFDNKGNSPNREKSNGQYMYFHNSCREDEDYYQKCKEYYQKCEGCGKNGNDKNPVTTGWTESGLFHEACRACLVCNKIKSDIKD